MGRVRLIGMHSHDVVDSNWPDRDFNFTTKYAADERQVANLTQPGMSATSVSTGYLPRAVSHKIEGGL